ncbi:hypothetical protein L207DRAFT_629218 [Hyaloscypha variabilis F]|uniref:Uncharacterized protein n=1 Tax=Hyaloscypha variabilis (strain UAMH 11265 / GT02V1 / F) TaxID=1149755 RepID=A0A2J6S7H0_HYAVF|nr:hypothetical protein L207DRAFT_629218 [Hyaloscypha variabilis F]
MVQRVCLLFLSLLKFTTLTLAQSCTPANARAIDADGEFIAYWEIIEVSWLAIADVKKRSLMSSLDKRDLVCASTEECLSFKGDPFCYNKAAHTFHAADGTTGNFLTGEYTLADGRVGNMYHGPYPTNTIAVAAVTQTASGSGAPATVPMSLVTLTAGGSITTSVGKSGGVSGTPTSQHGVPSSKEANPVGATVTVMPTPNSSTVLKSSEGCRIASFQSMLSSRLALVMLVVLLHL